ncbi:MAG: hypothetical protein ACLFMV_07045, partial [Spirochaetaceae bacterium]
PGTGGGFLICEIKRRSPSRGAIAGVEDPAALARLYVREGAGGISVLTEEDHFGGSLTDLLAVKRAVDVVPAVAEPASTLKEGAAFGPPVLRKDFLLDEADIEISYRAGADVVLLIAALLDEATLRRLHRQARSLGMAALVELYDEADVEKARGVAPALVGINSRDLTSFRVDRLQPLARAGAVDWPATLVYESGVRTGEDARVAATAGFSGLLVGETVVGAPKLIGELRAGFADGARATPLSRHGDGGPIRTVRGPAHLAAPESVAAPASARTAARTPTSAAARTPTSAPTPAPRVDFWTAVARRRKKKQAEGRPLVKICGITGRSDAEAAVAAGADMLGLVFAESPRRAQAELPAALFDLPVPKVAVVVAGQGRGLPEAVRRALADGYLDAVQLHGDETPEECAELAFPYYKALRLRSAADAGEIARYRCPRVLIDARVEGAYGGTGTRVGADAADAAAEQGPLWIAGGIGVENVGELTERHRPELIDASSRLELEDEPGRKDHEKLKRFFEEIAHATGVQRLFR